MTHTSHTRPSSTGSRSGSPFMRRLRGKVIRFCASLAFLGTVAVSNAQAVNASQALYVSFENGTIGMIDSTTGNYLGQFAYNLGGNLDSAYGGEMVFGADNTMYISSYSNGTIVKVDTTTGLDTIFASSPSMSGPWGMTIDSTTGDIYTADYSNNTIFRTPTIGVSAGQATVFTPNVNENIYYPVALALDGNGRLFVSQYYNDVGGEYGLQVVPTTGENAGVNSAFNHNEGGSLDFSYGGMAIDANGNLYISNYGNNTISIVPTIGENAGIDRVFASNVNGTIDTPYGLSIDAQGNLYVVNYGSNTISKISPDGVDSIFTATLPYTAAFMGIGPMLNIPGALPTAYWLGQTDGTWNELNWATNSTGTASSQTPVGTTDVIFAATGASHLDTTLDEDLTIKSLTVNDTVSISGESKLSVNGDTRVDNGSLTLSGGVTVAGINNFIGTDANQTGSVTVTNGSNWTATEDLNVGFAGKNATLTVSDFSTVTASDTKIGGSVGADGNSITLSGMTSLTNSGDLTVGYGGNGNSLTLSNGASATNVNAFIGYRFDESSTSNNNTVTVSGGRWTNTGVLYLGAYGTGNSLTVSDGGQVSVQSADAVVGDHASSTGNTLTVTGKDSQFKNEGSKTFYLGKAGGSNTLSVLDGGTMSTNNVRLGGDATSDGNTATVDGAHSVWNATGTQFRVGSGGSDNTLNITDGGEVNVTNGLTLLGRDEGSNDNTVKISGTDSSLRTVDLTIGRNGTGNTLIVADNGSLTLTACRSNILIAENSGSSGILQIGDGAAAGTVNADKITGGAGTAVVAFNHTESAYTFDPKITGSVSVQQNGSGTTIFETSSKYTGTTDVNAGALVVNGSLCRGATFTVASGAMVAGTGSVSLAENQSMFVNGVLSVGDFTDTCSGAAVFSVTTSGTGGLVMGAGSAIVVDLFSGAGQGSNIHCSSAADQLSIVGTLDASAGGVLYLNNPNAMTGFAIGDQWKVVDLNCGDGSITGNLAVNDSALGLAALGYAGVFDSTTGIVTIEDHRAQYSATQSGLPMANAQNQAVISGMQAATGDVNNHLFNLRNGGGEEAESDGSISASLDYGVVVGEGDGPESPIARRVQRSRQWEVFTTVNYGNVKLSPINAQAGVQVDSWASSVGIERHLSRSVSVGFAATFLQSTQTYTGGLGKLDLEGPTLSAYISYARKNFWGSLLYSFGTYDLGSSRNTGFGLPVASGATRAYTNAIQYNTGWNFRFQNNTLVTGPFVGIDYLHGTVDGYTETGGGVAALSYGKQSFESLVTRIGWSTSKKLSTSWADITPQIRFSYERQNLKNNGTSVQSITAPFSATGGNQTPGQDYMVIGTGVNFQFTPEFNMQLGYQVQLFRNNMESHFGSVRFGYKF